MWAEVLWAHGRGVVHLEASDVAHAAGGFFCLVGRALLPQIGATLRRPRLGLARGGEQADVNALWNAPTACRKRLPSGLHAPLRMRGARDSPAAAKRFAAGLAQSLPGVPFPGPLLFWGPPCVSSSKGLYSRVLRLRAEYYVERVFTLTNIQIRRMRVALIFLNAKRQ